jgi:hypothetical protein
MREGIEIAESGTPVHSLAKRGKARMGVIIFLSNKLVFIPTNVYIH